MKATFFENVQTNAYNKVIYFTAYMFYRMSPVKLHGPLFYTCLYYCLYKMVSL